MLGIFGLQNVNLIFLTFKDVHQFVSPYKHSSNPGEEFSKLLHDTGFEVINWEYRDGQKSYDTFDSLRGDCGIHISLILKIIFMQVILLCLLLNKPRFFSLIIPAFILSI
jgi:hypothetical protein